MDKLEAVIKALGVSQVVWIDDMFATEKSERGGDPTSVAKAILAAQRSEDLGVSRELESPLEVLADRLQSDPALYQRAAAMLEEIGQNPAAAENARLIDGIEGNIHCPLLKRSAKNWQSALASADAIYANTLFLVDRDFTMEGLADEESDALLLTTVAKFLATGSTNFCVVLSKNVAEPSEMRDREGLLSGVFASYADKKGLLRFSAVSKLALKEDPAGALANRLTKRLAGAVLVEMFEQLQQAMKRSVLDLESALVEDFEDLNKAVLINSYNEGISELDVLLRIANQNHKLTLSSMMGSPDGASLRQTLGRFRLFQLDHDVAVERHEIEPSARLKNLARAEIITTGAQVNQMHLPIVPGDVFVTLPAGTDITQALPAPYQDIAVGQQYWMLLGQLCDVVLRSKSGEAKAKLGLLAPFTVINAGVDQDAFETKKVKDFRVGRRKCVSAADFALAFDFGTIQTANIAALQFVAFDVNGVAQLSTTPPADAIWSYASVARARRNVHELLDPPAAAAAQPMPASTAAEPVSAAPAEAVAAEATATTSATPSAVTPEVLEYYAVGFDGKDSDRKMQVTGASGARTYAYRIKRVCRIRETEAVEALAALQRYWTRIAKPHDFAQ
jgi:hypothetical protein